MSEINQNDYQRFVIEIKQRIKDAQYTALKFVNKELISLYWDIGKRIVEKQESSGWGKSIVENLAKDLQKEYSGIKGFSSANLWRMRTFYLKYQNNEKLEFVLIYFESLTPFFYILILLYKQNQH